jgi:hypothetical protein
MEQRLSSQANNLSAIQEIHALYGTRKFILVAVKYRH